MVKSLLGSILAGMLLTVVLSPFATAGIGTSPSGPSHWTFTVDEQGEWHAMGQHVSFAWTLKPFEIYDVKVDGMMVLDELSFPFDADGYQTHGTTFVVMLGGDELLSWEDTSSSQVDVNCNGRTSDPTIPPDPCDLEFPKGTDVMGPAPGTTKVTRLDADLPSRENGIDPCWFVTVRGTYSVDGSMVMFTGDASMRLQIVSPGPPQRTDRWTFSFDAQGVWHADGQHVSFSWNLKPSEIYDLMVDGVMVVDELSFPVDGDAYMTEGAAFKVMRGEAVLFQLLDNPVTEMRAHCAASPRDPALPPGPCDVEFPEGSEVMPMAGGEGKHVSLYHVEYQDIAGTIRPCGTLGVRGTSSVDGTMVMFEGDMSLHYPVGQSMVG